MPVYTCAHLPLGVIQLYTPDMLHGHTNRTTTSTPAATFCGGKSFPQHNHTAGASGLSILDTTIKATRQPSPRGDWLVTTRG